MSPQIAPAPQRNAALDALARGLFCCVVLVAVFHFGRLTVNPEHRPRYDHWDEARWIWVSYHTWIEASEGRIRSGFWREEFWGWGSPNPALGKYFIGAPVARAMRRDPGLTLPPFESLHQEAIVDIPRQLLHPARVQAAFFTLAALVFAMMLARDLFGPAAAALGGAIALAHPYLQGQSFRAMTDACALAGAALAMWGAWRRRPAWGLAAAGIGLGWAAATRINGALILPAILAARLTMAPPGRRVREAILWSAVPLAIALPIVYLTNPYLLLEPLAGWKTMVGNLPGGGGFLTTLRPEKLRFAAIALFLQEGFNARIPPWPPAAALTFLAASGAGLAAAAGSLRPRRRALAAMTATLLLLLLLLGPTYWARHYLAGTLAMSICAGFGAVTAGRLVLPGVAALMRAARAMERADTAPGRPAPR